MQTTKLTNKPFAEVAAAIQALDLESVKLRLMDPELGEGWTREYADSVATAYKTYLTMVAKYQEHAEDIMLAKDVDEFWHTHILQTMKYSDDCQRVFGTYLHHNPHVGPRTAADLQKRNELADKTRRLYAREFGSDLGAAWAGTIRPAAAAYSSAAISGPAAAYSSAAVNAGSAAYSSAALSARDGAYSSAAIRSNEAAYSSAAIREGAAAYSSAAIRADGAAYSSAAIDERAAAYSSAAIAANAGYSSAAIAPQRAAYSSAALRKA